MNSEPHIAIQQRFFRWAGYLVIAVIAISFLVLVGWQFDLEFFKRPLPHLVAMNPATALLFILSGIAFFLLVKRSPQYNKAAYAISCILILVAVLRIFDIMFATGMQVDRILFSHKLVEDAVTNISNHMAPNTAACFILTGISLLLFYNETSRKKIPANYFSLLVALLGFFSMLGYLYKVPLFYGLLAYIPMAIHTAISFFFLSLAILFANPGKGIMKMITGKLTGSITARLLIPVAILVPVILGLFRLYGYWMGLFSTEFGVAILVLSIIIVFLVIIWYNALLLNKRDRQRILVEEKVQQFNENLEEQVKTKTGELVGIFERITDGFIALDKSFCYTYVNKKTGELVHRDPKTLIGKNVWKEFPQATDSPTYKAFLQAMREQHYIVNIDYYPPLDLWQENHIYPSPEGLSVFIKDITERKRAEEKLRSAHQKLLFHVENTPLGFIEWDDQLHVRSWSKRAEEIFGWSEQEFIRLQKDGYSQVYEEDLPWVGKIANELIAGKIERNILRHRNYAKDGGVIWCEWFNSVLKDPDGKVITIWSLVQDITERKKAEDRIKFKAHLLNTVGQAVIATDMKGIVDYWNSAAEKMYGWTAEEAIGRNIIDLTPALQSIDQAAEIMKVLSKGNVWSGEFLVRRKDGSVFPAFVTDSPLYDEQGNLNGIIGISADISERKKAEDTLTSLEKEIVEQKIQEQKKISRAIIQGQEEEKNHIGRELHDNINQILAGTKLYMGVAANRDAAIKEALKYPMELIDTAVEEIRSLSHRQVTPLKNINLDEMVRDLLATLDKSKNIAINFTCFVSNEKLSDDLKLNIYRIIQVQINNIIKHADAKKVGISIKEQNAFIEIITTDNGKGFDVNTRRKGIGISNMINRIESYNGKMKIISNPGKGCEIRIIIPLNGGF